MNSFKLNQLSETQIKDSYTDEEVNELAEWFQEITIKQAFFLKETYERHLEMQSHECGHLHVH